MNWLQYLPWIIAACAGGFLVFFLFTYIRTKKLPPTDEPEVGRYRIEVNVGTHIVPFEGSLYYFNKLLNPKHLHQYAETLGAEMKTSLAELKNFLKDEAYFYAMRQGTRKLAFISLHHPIEISPFFKTEQDTGRKIVHATGTIGKKTKGFQHVTMEPINLSDYELNPQEYQTLDHTGKLLTELLEKAPLIEELEAREEELRVVRSKTHELADEVGRKTDEAEYWRHEAKRKGISHTEEEGLEIPGFLKTILPYGIAALLGWLVSPQLVPEHPPYYLAALSPALLLIVRKVTGR